jgi:hypothetical protein
MREFQFFESIIKKIKIKILLKITLLNLAVYLRN